MERVMNKPASPAPRKRVSTRLHLLTVREVQTAKDGDHGDGGGLLLRVRGDWCSWVFRYTSPTGRRREMGLGVAYRGSAEQAGDSVKSARRAAQEAREQLDRGIDPLDAREARTDDAKRQEAAKKAEKLRERWTLARAARDYHERVIEPTRSSKHAAQWIASLENHMPPSIWNMPVGDVEPPALLEALRSITPHERARNLKGEDLPETVQRIRQRLDAIFEDAIFHKRCTSNPAAAIQRKLREGQKRERGSFRAMDYREAPAFLAELRKAEGVAARCLEFAVLTAARTAEAISAEWCEFDLEAGTWTVPGSKMKGKETHVVFLSPRALEIVKQMEGANPRFVFPSPWPVKERDGDRPMSNMAMLVTLGRLGVRDRTTVHGLARATFSTWANETGAGRPDVIEACLAHKEANRVRAAYNRTKFNDERRALLSAWSEFLARQPAQVLPLRAA
jgi:integrase